MINRRSVQTLSAVSRYKAVHYNTIITYNVTPSEVEYTSKI